MLFVPGTGDFRTVLTNVTARPSGTANGTTVTAGGTANTKGAWAQLMPAISRDAYGILIQFTNGAASATARNRLTDIGIDFNGGTSYTVLIPDLVDSGSAPNTLLGVWYYFPLYIPAGSSIAARSQCLTASATCGVHIQLMCDPARPDGIRAGTSVSAYGVNNATSAGTIVTPGTTAEGNWTSLGTTTGRHWWWQTGMGCNDTTQSAQCYSVDISAGSSTTDNRILIQNQYIYLTAAEQQMNSPLTVGCAARVGVGENIYGRIQCSGTPDSNVSLIAYGLN